MKTYTIKERIKDNFLYTYFIRLPTPCFVLCQAYNSPQRSSSRGDIYSRNLKVICILFSNIDIDVIFASEFLKNMNIRHIMIGSDMLFYLDSLL